MRMKITLGQDVSKVFYYCMNTGSMSHFIGVPSLTVFLTIKCCTCHKFLVFFLLFFCWPKAMWIPCIYFPAAIYLPAVNCCDAITSGRMEAKLYEG